MSTPHPRRRRNQKRTRIRSTQLDELNASQLALAVWLLARQVVDDETDRPQPGPEVVSGSNVALPEPTGDQEGR